MAVTESKAIVEPTALIDGRGAYGLSLVLAASLRDGLTVEQLVRQMRFPPEVAAAAVAAERVLEDTGERWRIARRPEPLPAGNAGNEDLSAFIPEPVSMIPTSTASEILSRSQRRVCQLARAGVIVGERTPDGWLLDAESVHAYAKQAAAA